jgi:hypothetical protein
MHATTLITFMFSARPLTVIKVYNFSDDGHTTETNLGGTENYLQFSFKKYLHAVSSKVFFLRIPIRSMD